MDNLFKNKAYKILELFIEHPHKEFYIREIARELRLSHAIVIKYIRELTKLKLIEKNSNNLYPVYSANYGNARFLFYKRNYILFKIITSGLVDYLWKKTLAESIVLFGSCATGDFTEKSDIDVFIESKEIKLDLSKYEKMLKRKINLLFEPDIDDLSKGLKYNIVKGITLYGSLKID